MKIVCIGDSLTYGYPAGMAGSWPAAVAAKTGLDIVNRGVCGDTTQGMNGRFERDVLALCPQGVCITGGSNDILEEVPAAQAARFVRTMAERAQSCSMAVFIGIPPLTQPESAYYGWQTADRVLRHNEELSLYRRILLQLVREQHLTCIDFLTAIRRAGASRPQPLYEDGVHMTAAGYAVMAAEAAACMRRSLEPSPGCEEDDLS